MAFDCVMRLRALSLSRPSRSWLAEGLLGVPTFFWLVSLLVMQHGEHTDAWSPWRRKISQIHLLLLLLLFWRGREKTTTTNI
jgi:hypothetical protein